MNIFTPPTLPLIDPGRTFSADCLIWTNAFTPPFVGWYAERGDGHPGVWHTYTPVRQLIGTKKHPYQASCASNAVTLEHHEVVAWAYIPVCGAVVETVFPKSDPAE